MAKYKEKKIRISEVLRAAYFQKTKPVYFKTSRDFVKILLSRDEFLILFPYSYINPLFDNVEKWPNIL